MAYLGAPSHRRDSRRFDISAGSNFAFQPFLQPASFDNGGLHLQHQPPFYFGSSYALPPPALPLQLPPAYPALNGSSVTFQQHRPPPQRLPLPQAVFTGGSSSFVPQPPLRGPGSGAARGTPHARGGLATAAAASSSAPSSHTQQQQQQQQQQHDRAIMAHLHLAARAVFPTSYLDGQLTNAGSTVRCGLVVWLLEQGAVSASAFSTAPPPSPPQPPRPSPAAAGEPGPTGPPPPPSSTVPLSMVLRYFREQHPGLWQNPAVFQRLQPADFLRHPDSRGVFRVLNSSSSSSTSGSNSTSGSSGSSATSSAAAAGAAASAAAHPAGGGGSSSSGGGWGGSSSAGGSSWGSGSAWGSSDGGGSTWGGSSGGGGSSSSSSSRGRTAALTIGDPAVQLDVEALLAEFLRIAQQGYSRSSSSSSSSSGSRPGAHTGGAAFAADAAAAAAAVAEAVSALAHDAFPGPTRESGLAQAAAQGRYAVADPAALNRVYSAAQARHRVWREAAGWLAAVRPRAPAAADESLLCARLSALREHLRRELADTLAACDASGRRRPPELTQLLLQQPEARAVFRIVHQAGGGAAAGSTHGAPLLTGASADTEVSVLLDLKALWRAGVAASASPVVSCPDLRAAAGISRAPTPQVTGGSAAATTAQQQSRGGPAAPQPPPPLPLPPPPPPRVQAAAGIGKPAGASAPAGGSGSSSSTGTVVRSPAATAYSSNAISAAATDTATVAAVCIPRRSASAADATDTSDPLAIPTLAAADADARPSITATAGGSSVSHAALNRSASAAAAAAATGSDIAAQQVAASIPRRSASAAAASVPKASPKAPDTEADASAPAPAAAPVGSSWRAAQRRASPEAPSAAAAAVASNTSAADTTASIPRRSASAVDDAVATSTRIAIPAPTQADAKANAPATAAASVGSSWRAALTRPAPPLAGAAAATAAIPQQTAAATTTHAMGSSALTAPARSGAPPSSAPVAAASSSSPSATAADADPLQPLRCKPVRELARMAWPTHVHGQPVKDAVARQLRRAIAVWLDEEAGGSPAAQQQAPSPGLGPRRAPLTHVGQFLRQQHGSVWLDSHRKWPKLKEFLTQPQSRGVFKLAARHGGGGVAAAAAAEPVAQLDMQQLVRAAAEPAPAGAPAAAEAVAGAGSGSGATAGAAKVEDVDSAGQAGRLAPAGVAPRAAGGRSSARGAAPAAPGRQAQHVTAGAVASATQPATVGIRLPVVSAAEEPASAGARQAAATHAVAPNEASEFGAPWTEGAEGDSEQTLQQQHAASSNSAGRGSSSSNTLSFPLPSAEELAASGLPAVHVISVSDPYGEEFLAMLQHCRICPQLGLAVRSYYGLPVLLTLYAPEALMPQTPAAANLIGSAEGGGGAAADGDGMMLRWPAAAYVVDLLAAQERYGGGEEGQTAAAALLINLRPLLEAPEVVKVVHDGRGGAEAVGNRGAVAVLEAAISASGVGMMVLGEDGVTMVPAAAGGPCRIAPLHDTRLVLRGLEAMLGLPHAPEGTAAAAAAATSAAPGTAGAGMGVQAQLRALHSHVARLRDALAGTGLWADRPALLTALAAHHFAVMRQELVETWACNDDGGAVEELQELLMRPLGAGDVEAVAGLAEHLPELWGELVGIGLPQAIWRDIIKKVSDAGLFADSKHFVDCPALRPWALVAEDWERLEASGINTEDLKTFIAANFGSPGSDLQTVLPAGWHEVPPAWLAGLSNEKARAFCGDVYQLWTTLCRQVSPDVLANPDRHTLLPLPHPFIVPGDRFRECYNWDSYWVILGLLASGLLPAARQLLSNLLGLVDVWGFVPNGARAYYTNRSQPPLLSAMVAAVAEATAAADEEQRENEHKAQGTTTGASCNGTRPGSCSDCTNSSTGGSGEAEALLREALPRLIAQHGYWTSGRKVVRVRSAGGSEAGNGAGTDGSGGRGGGESCRDRVYELSRYHAELYEPRPESFREDLDLVEGLGLGPEAARALYCDIASAAESGWDFSTRWFVGGDTLGYTRTTQIVPADLNAWLYRTERDISRMAGALGDDVTADAFAARAVDRAAAMDALMWSDAGGCWHDLLLLPPSHSPATSSRPPAGSAAASPFSAAAGAADAAEAQGGGQEPREEGCAPLYDTEQRAGVYASNWVPLWCGVAPPGSAQAAAAAAGLLSSGLLQPGGLLTSLYRSGQQWDAPNSWPPLVHMAVDGLERSGAPGAADAAAGLARSYVAGCRAAWEATGHMHEKYDAAVPGGVGRGGEYVPQVGFGWSNGVLLALMHRYGV
ncbi:hypothetical protein HYH02_012630 [Chlamydomonas schloesseri]|uniref:Trehalase n=1 Tax=Chlamydomonas schloesseri TaxID=2026947 RepID=A0A835VY18_9CHLO|nr:hypothetical protein HYH02_012630 [Chlamydomonas schloesseri]|eukprot:KAG2433512.1 hypothetical protein HYH02_012630 [Chlamydomonas schloesseri]